MTITDHHSMAAWRDAALAGALPQPSRADRWQPLRAGVVNLWEFDAAEVWYADGRMQLQGANESGKSTLMTLTTLLLLDGALHGRNIDTLGESGKQFRYYVEPGHHPLERRDASKQRHRGWAWVEYGRMQEDGAEFFTCLLCAETRRGDPEIRRHWCTLHGTHRIRDGVTLASAALPTEPGQLREVPGFTPHRTAAAYREEIARVLFGTSTSWLDQLVRTLRVVRTPKIGDRLDLEFLKRAFRQALPPLAEDEIRQLAEGWEQLDRLRKEKDTAEQALDAVTGFTRQRWRPWAQAVVRAAADPVIAANDDFDNVTRLERTTSQAAEALAEQVRTAEERLQALITEMEQTKARREALQQRKAYQDAVEATTTAQHLAEQASAAKKRVDQVRGDLAVERSRLESAEAGLDAAKKELERAERAVTAAAGRVENRAEPAGLVADTTRFLPDRDVARLRQAGQRRDEATEQALTLWDEHAGLASKAEQAADRATEAERRAEVSRVEAEGAEAAVESTITTVVQQLPRWAAAAPEPLRPSRSLVDDWGRTLAAIADTDPPVPVLADAVTRDHLAPTRRPLEQTRAELSHELTENRVAQERLQRELAIVEAERDPPPREPDLWQRRSRPPGITDQGAPLWRLVEVEPGLSPAALASLEATLAAAGLLEAWVTPDGSYLADRDGSDTVWFDPETGAEPARSLRAALRPADDAASLSGVVDRLLSAVRYLDSALHDLGRGTLPTIGRDGSWRHGTLAGAASPPADGPRLLGTAARAADRARRIASLRVQVDELATRQERIEARLAGTNGLLDALERLAHELPPDAPVVTVVVTLREAQRRASADARDAAKAIASARTAEERAATALTAIVAHADDHGLPRAQEAVRTVRDAVQEYLAAVTELAAAQQGVPPAEAALDRAAKTLKVAEDQHQRLTTDLADAENTAQQARLKAKEAAAALGKDAQQILAECGALGAHAEALGKSIKESQPDLEKVVKDKFKAEAELEQVADRRKRADERRHAAVATWFGCIDTSLPQLCGLPEPSARHLTAAVDSARAARATIAPRDWPRDSREVDKMREWVQRAWQRMTQDVLTLRSSLEAQGGRTARAVIPGDDDPPGYPGRVEVVVDTTGVAYQPPTAAERLLALVNRLTAEYDEELTRTIDELLGSTFIEHLRDRLKEAELLRREINDKLAQHPTTTSRLRLRLERVPVAEEGHANQVLFLLERDFGLLEGSLQQQIRDFLSRRIDQAQEQAQAAGDPDWRARLQETLDYRRWFDLQLEFRAQHGDGSRWQPLDRGNHTLLSGGAKVVTLLQPFVAALHAMYDQARSGPRMMWLDEAFDGVDPANRAAMLKLLTECDLDWLMAGPGTIANAPAVPLAAVYEVRRAPGAQPGVSLELALWSGGELTHLATPDPADLPDLAMPTPAPAGDDLLSGLVP